MSEKKVFKSSLICCKYSMDVLSHSVRRLQTSAGLLRNGLGLGCNNSNICTILSSSEIT